jgi:hypothetical protein
MKILPSLIAMLVLVPVVVFGAKKKLMTCRVTGKTMDNCCCEMKAGKFYCKLTKKTYDKCCCDMK